MPAIGFVYPDGDKISFEDAIDNGKLDEARMGITYPILKAIRDSERTNPSRPPSTTELQVGTCEAYLRRTNEYHVNPQERVYAIVGHMMHSLLEKNKRLKDITERTLDGYDITGMPDNYNPELQRLIDYKFVGSYKAMKVLGMTYVMKDHPAGEKYKRTGSWGKAGTIKKVKHWYRDPEKADLGDWAYQLNWYKYLLGLLGYEVKTMCIQMIVRDSGLQVSRDRGIKQAIYYVDVPDIEKEILLEYFLNKRDELLYALNKLELPEECTEEERWGNTKCQHYCEVRHLCPYNKKRSE